VAEVIIASGPSLRKREAALLRKILATRRAAIRNLRRYCLPFDDLLSAGGRSVGSFAHGVRVRIARILGCLHVFAEKLQASEAGNAIAETSQPAILRREDFMANWTFGAGFVRDGARVAHVFLQDQVLTILAPLYYLSHQSIAEPSETIASPTCGPTRTIDLQPTGIGRS